MDATQTAKFYQIQWQNPNNLDETFFIAQTESKSPEQDEQWVRDMVSRVQAGEFDFARPKGWEPMIYVCNEKDSRFKYFRPVQGE